MKKYKKYSLEKIYKSPQTIFTVKDLALLWNSSQPKLIWARANDYAKTNKLYRLRKGIYAKDKNYNKFELATKIYTPSYISLETVLTKKGVVFQYYDTIFVISYLSRDLEVDGKKIRIRKIKQEVLTNSQGIVKKENHYQASKERAFLDAIYLYKNYHFDNLETLNKEKVLKLAPLYKNKQLIKRVKKYLNA